MNAFLQRDLLRQADIANQQTPGERDPNITVAELLDRAAQAIDVRFHDQAETEALLRLTLGKTYMGVGKDAEARTHLQRSVALRTERLGATHPDTLVSKHHLAMVCGQLGMLDAAEVLYREVLAARTEQPAGDLSDTLGSMNNLAMMYLAQGKIDRAEPLLKEILRVCVARLGDDHSDTLTCKNNLVKVYHARKDYFSAEKLLGEVIGLQTAKQRPDHPNTLVGHLPRPWP